MPDPSPYDVVVVTDLINLSDLRAVWQHHGTRRSSLPPVLLYMHETQITYPPPRSPRQRGTRDPTTEFQDIKNCLVAERVLFNSNAHRSTFLAAVENLADQPDLAPLARYQEIAARSTVVYPGVTLPDVRGSNRLETGPPRIVWNHRREYDKRPRRFFRALCELAQEGVPFEVIVLGERPADEAPAITDAREALRDRIVHWGYVSSRHEYDRWLQSAYIVVSTAIQENFGIAMVEAIGAGCIPLLPRRLSYPEIIPESLHPIVLYDDDHVFTARLRDTILTLPELQHSCRGLATHMKRFTWETVVVEYDREIAGLIR